MSFVEEYKSDLINAIDAIDLAKVNQVIEIFKRARDRRTSYLHLRKWRQRIDRLAFRM